MTRATVSFVINQRAERSAHQSAHATQAFCAAIESASIIGSIQRRSPPAAALFGIGVMTPGGSKLTSAWCEQVEGIHQAADERGYHVVYVGLNEAALANPVHTQNDSAEPCRWRHFPDLRRPVDGLERAIRRYHIPTIWIQRRRRHDAIFSTKRLSRAKAQNTFLALGHQRISLLDSAS